MEAAAACTAGDAARTGSGATGSGMPVGPVTVVPSDSIRTFPAPWTWTYPDVPDIVRDGIVVQECLDGTTYSHSMVAGGLELMS